MLAGGRETNLKHSPFLLSLLDSLSNKHQTFKSQYNPFEIPTTYIPFSSIQTLPTMYRTTDESGESEYGVVDSDSKTVAPIMVAYCSDYFRLV